MRYVSLLFIALLSLGSASVAEAGPRLVLGDNAPSLDGEHWLGGGEVAGFEKGHIYAIEFWATWCKPCHASIPHLESLQAEHGSEFTVIAVTIESPETIAKFLAEEGLEGFGYTVVSDPDGSIYSDYMKNSLLEGIPMLFMVGRSGRIEWRGHPEAVDGVLDAMLSDAWDPYAHHAWEENLSTLERSLGGALRERNPAETLILSDLMLDHYEAGARPPYLDARGPITQLEMLRAQLLLLEIDEEHGYSYVRSLLYKYWSDPMVLNNLAWFIADDPEIEHRDLGLARVLSVRANELSDHGNAAYLDTLARIYFEEGDVETAIAWQETAVSKLKASDDPAPIIDALDRYRAHRDASPSTP